MDNDYKYLFPFEKIPQGAKILIYGAGILGQEYLKQLRITNYCHVIGFLDRNFIDFRNSVVPVYAPDDAGKLTFDFVVIALRSAIALESVKYVLVENGVPNEKIICVLERVLPQIKTFEHTDSKGMEYLYLASYEAKPSLALYMAGGMGDMMTYKLFVEELHRLVPTAIMDFYAVNGLGFLQWLYSEADYVKNILPDLGVRYNSSKNEYSLSLSIMGSGFLGVDNVNAEDFAEYKNFVNRIRCLEEKCKFENFNFSTPVATMFYRRILNGENCCTGFNYGGVFSIINKQVQIPQSQEFVNAFAALGLDDYITVNTGNGTGTDGVTISKAWPLERFQATLDMFRQRYPDIKVVQIGVLSEPLIDGADRHFMDKPFGLVAEILRHAVFHLDIEGGLVHLASQIGTKCVVLFGPTQYEYFSYEKNINIRVGKCHGCYGLYLDTNHCARHMKEPECMYGITPELVMSYIDEYMKEWERSCQSEKLSAKRNEAM